MIFTSLTCHPGQRRGNKRAFTVRQIDANGRHEVGVIAVNGIQAIAIAREVFAGQVRARDERSAA